MSLYEQLRGWFERPFAGYLCALGLSLFLAARHFFRMSPARAQTADKTDKLCALLGIALVCVLAVDAADQVDRRFQLGLGFAVKAVAIGAAVAGALVYLRFGFRSLNPAPVVGSTGAGPSFVARGVLLVSLGAAAWFGNRFYAVAFSPPQLVDESQIRGGLCESKDFVGWTDRGNEIRLFRLIGEQDEPAGTSGGRQTATDDYPEMAILRQSRNVSSNCHGWVFCEGRYVLPGDDIERILEDNRYAAVEKPLAGDLILYREVHGQIIHSGVVRGILDDGTVMVESKWGVDRRYLHTACDQPYSQLYTYYRSPRRGHRLTITKTLPADLRLSPDDKRALHSILHEVPNNAATSHVETAKSSTPAPQG